MFTPNGQFTLQVLVDDLPLQEYPYQTERFIEGMIGRQFQLRIGKAQLSRRVVAVISVDGLSIMDGKPAKADGSGYIIEAGNESLDIPGWRLNDQEVAAFIFASLPEAYAAQMGKPANIGVIGAKFFYEQLPKQPQEPLSVSASFPAAPPPQGASGWGSPVPVPAQAPFAPGAAPGSRSRSPSTPAPSAPGVGTGFGNRLSHSVSIVPFERDQATAQTLVLRYDTAANLEARGIVLAGRKDRVLQADPFPGDSGCTPPPGWTGV